LTGNLPEFLSALCVRTPAIRVFFDIFICKHRLKSPSSMIEIEHIFDEETIDGQCRDEDLIPPLTDALAHRNPLAWCGGSVSSHNDTGLRHFSIQLQPTSIKQLDYLLAVDSGHACRWWVSQHVLDLRVFQDSIPSRSCDQMHACFNQLSNGYGITILPVEANERDLWSESKEPQVGRDGSKGRSEFTLIVTIASARIGADPLAGMHLKGDGACADDLPSFSPCVAWRTDRTESASRGRQRWITGQRSLPRRLAGGIHVKNEVAAALTIPNATDRLRGPSLSKAVLLAELAKSFQAGPIYTREKTTQRGTMGKISTPKQGHECSAKGS
jgi:hypothetical protein